jgi:hypothetical protein
LRRDASHLGVVDEEHGARHGPAKIAQSGVLFLKFAPAIRALRPGSLDLVDADPELG